MFCDHLATTVDVAKHDKRLSGARVSLKAWIIYRSTGREMSMKQPEPTLSRISTSVYQLNLSGFNNSSGLRECQGTVSIITVEFYSISRNSVNVSLQYSFDRITSLYFSVSIRSNSIIPDLGINSWFLTPRFCIACHRQLHIFSSNFAYITILREWLHSSKRTHRTCWGRGENRGFWCVWLRRGPR